jgi:hypothetical protein
MVQAAIERVRLLTEALRPAERHVELPPGWSRTVGERAAWWNPPRTEVVVTWYGPEGPNQMTMELEECRES